MPLKDRNVLALTTVHITTHDTGPSEANALFCIHSWHCDQLETTVIDPHT